MPPNDDTTIKLAQVEVKLQSVVAIVERIESFIERFVSIDRTIAELVIQHSHTQEKIADLRNSVAAGNQAHRAAIDALSARVEGAVDRGNALENKSSGALKIVSWFCGLATAAMIGCGSWVFQTASDSAKVNAVQQERIERLERDLSSRDRGAAK